jgi:hypothetical protein
MRPTLFIALSVVLFTLTGCASSPDKAPLLAHRAQLQVNAGETVRVEGTARFSHVSGPSVAGDDFEVRVYPRTIWGPETDGKKVEVTGKLNDSNRTTPPDPSITPGEYWLSDATLAPTDAAEKKK